MSADQNKHQDSNFRDKLTTVSEEGKRVWVYPKKPKGRYYNWRRMLASILLGFFFFLCLVGCFFFFTGPATVCPPCGPAFS